MSGYAPPPPARETATGEHPVTLDLDDADPLDLFRAVSRLRGAGAYGVEARVSASGEGFHVRGWLDADEADEGTVERLRLAAGDHPRRTRFDREHHIKPQQVLFASKPGGEAGPWHANPFDAAAELRARSDRYGLAGWSR
jgi:hypothetical protein